MLCEAFQRFHKFRRKLLKRAIYGRCLSGINRLKNRAGIFPALIGQGDAFFFRTVFPHESDIVFLCAFLHNGIQRRLWKLVFFTELFLRMNVSVSKSIKKGQHIVFNMEAPGAFVVEPVDNVGTGPEPVYIFPFLIQNISFSVFCFCRFCMRKTKSEFVLCGVP